MCSHVCSVAEERANHTILRIFRTFPISYTLCLATVRKRILFFTLSLSIALLEVLDDVLPGIQVLHRVNGLRLRAC